LAAWHLSRQRKRLCSIRAR